MLGGIAVYGSGVMLASLWKILTNLPVSLYYVGAFVVPAILLIPESGNPLRLTLLPSVAIRRISYDTYFGP